MAIERVIYGMTADYRLTGYWVLKDDNPSIEHLRYFANRIADAYPGTVHCWAIDNSPVVRHVKEGSTIELFSNFFSRKKEFGYSNRPGGDLQSLFPFIFTSEVQGCIHLNGGASR